MMDVWNNVRDNEMSNKELDRWESKRKCTCHIQNGFKYTSTPEDCPVHSKIYNYSKLNQSKLILKGSEK